MPLLSAPVFFLNQKHLIPYPPFLVCLFCCIKCGHAWHCFNKWFCHLVYNLILELGACMSKLIHHEAPKYPKRDSRNFQRHELLSNVQDLTYSLHKSYFIFTLPMDYLFLECPKRKVMWHRSGMEPAEWQITAALRREALCSRHVLCLSGWFAHTDTMSVSYSSWKRSLGPWALPGNTTLLPRRESYWTITGTICSTHQRCSQGSCRGEATEP